MPKRTQTVVEAGEEATPHEVAAIMLTKDGGKRIARIRKRAPARRTCIQAVFLLRQWGNETEARDLWALLQLLFPSRPGRPRAVSGMARVYRAHRPSNTDITDHAYVRIPVMSLGVRWGEEVTAIFARGTITLTAGRAPFVTDEGEAASKADQARATKPVLERLEENRQHAAARGKGAPKGQVKADSVFALYDDGGGA